MKTRIILVRHGKSMAAEQGLVQGSGLEVPLSAEGEEQARNLARMLQTEKLDAIFCSHARRARDTASPVRAIHAQVPYEEIPELVERSKGAAEGMTKEAYREMYPELHAQWLEEIDARPPGGESFEDVHARVVPVLEKHLAAYSIGSTLLYVIHGNVIRVLLGHMLQIPFGRQARIEQGYCAINVVEYDHDRRRWSVQCINRLPDKE